MAPAGRAGGERDDAPPVLTLGAGCAAALLVAGSGLLAQGLSFSDLAFSLFWPPAGIAFALIWHFGRRALIAVALGIALPTLLFYPSWGSLLVILGETLGPWAGVSLLRGLWRRAGAPRSPMQWQIAFYLCGLLVGCPIAALLGSLGAVAGHRFALASVPSLFLAYSVVESIGLVLFAPPLIDWLAHHAKRGRTRLAVGARWPWILAAPVLIETARWFLFANVNADYANLLIYCYFPLVAWCALTESSRRTHGLLVEVAILVLSSQAWWLREASAPNSAFDLFRFALVILTLSGMGQLLAALASERRSAFAELARQMDLDPLTGLLNERSFTSGLDDLPRPLKIVLLTFENWPEFEILAGIGASYDLQIEVTELLRSKSALGHIARLQPGSFACVLAGGAPWPETLEDLLRRRWVSAGVEMRLVGVALNVPVASSGAAGELLLGARTLLNEALLFVDDQPLVRDWSVDLVAERRAQELLVDTIKQAIRSNRLSLFAQPIAWSRPAHRASLEILVRIEGDDGETLPSAEVARILSQNLISKELDRAVIEATFAWFGERKEALAVVDRVAINLAGASLSAPHLFEWIERCRGAAGVSAESFAFEITESQAILNVDSARVLVERLRRAGYHVALDDFGTGLATFDYLKTFAVDYIKIDGSFIRNLAKSPIDREIVSGIVRLARLMQVDTVAEYVFDDATGRMALGAGVDALQGFAIAAPVPLSAAIELCRSAKARQWISDFAASAPRKAALMLARVSSAP